MTASTDLEPWEEIEERHNAYIDRLSGRDPGPKTELMKILTVVRNAKAGIKTSDVARARQLYVHERIGGVKRDSAVYRLRHLQERGLIARQEPMYVGPGSYESTWMALETAEWPVKKVKRGATTEAR